MACRFFIGIPEVEQLTGDLRILLNVWVGRILPRSHLPPFPLVYEEGTPNFEHTPTTVLTMLSQELAFRSAFLYTGLLVSNAFGTVSR